eukprot:1848983-Prymnesium_polylepis.1
MSGGAREPIARRRQRCRTRQRRTCWSIIITHDSTDAQPRVSNRTALRLSWVKSSENAERLQPCVTLTRRVPSPEFSKKRILSPPYSRVCMRVELQHALRDG